MVGIKDFEMPSCCNSCEHWSFTRDDEPVCDLTYEDIRQFDKRQDDCPLVEAIPKADYETRLKADMVAMLTDIQLEIREYHEIGCDEDCKNCRMVGCVEPVNVIKDLDIIQQKIDDLKGEQA